MLDHDHLNWGPIFEHEIAPKKLKLACRKVGPFLAEENPLEMLEHDHSKRETTCWTWNFLRNGNAGSSKSGTSSCTTRFSQIANTGSSKKGTSSCATRFSKNANSGSFKTGTNTNTFEQFFQKLNPNLWKWGQFLRWDLEFAQKKKSWICLSILMVNPSDITFLHWIVTIVMGIVLCNRFVCLSDWILNIVPKLDLTHQKHIKIKNKL